MPGGANVAPVRSLKAGAQAPDIASGDEEAASRPKSTNDRSHGRPRILEVLDHFDHCRGIEGTWWITTFLQRTNLDQMPTGSSFSGGNRCDFLTLCPPAHVASDIQQRTGSATYIKESTCSAHGAGKQLQPVAPTCDEAGIGLTRFRNQATLIEAPSKEVVFVVKRVQIELAREIESDEPARPALQHSVAPNRSIGTPFELSAADAALAVKQLGASGGHDQSSGPGL